MNCTDTIPAAAAHPAPPLPCDVDLRDFRFMPLDVVRLQNSETWAVADGWTAKALVNLWVRAWHQVPAGSLPDDDNLHRAWANVPDWESVRNVALRGFVKCSDDRLYHPVICEKAIDAWNKRKRFRRAANARWKNEKHAAHMQRTPDEPSSHDATHIQGTGRGKGKRKNAADAAPVVRSEEADLFRRGKEILGDTAGGLIKNLVKAKAGSVPLARAAIETAATKQDPREYIAACIHGPGSATQRTNGWDPGL